MAYIRFNEVGLVHEIGNVESDLNPSFDGFDLFGVLGLVAC